MEGIEEYEIVDGNVDPDPWESLRRLMRHKTAELLAVSVMPGPQMKAAIPLCRAFREEYPSVPIVWGGYFPVSLPGCGPELVTTSTSPFAARARILSSS